MFGAALFVGGVVSAEPARGGIGETEGTSVMVTLPGGARLVGKLKPKAFGLRLTNGQSVALTCTVAQAGNAYAVCELKYQLFQVTQKPLSSPAMTNQPHHLTFSANENGVPSIEFISLERPLRWVSGIGQ